MRNLLIGMVVGAVTMASLAPAHAIISGNTAADEHAVEVSVDGSIVDTAVAPHQTWIEKTVATN